jgi:phosphatidate phosphatase APP1
MLLKGVRRITGWFRRLRLAAKRRFGGFDSLRIYPFRGYGTPYRVHVVGRLLESNGVVDRPQGGNLWQNLKDTVRRFYSEEIPDARMQVRIGGCRAEVHTDFDGYFHAVLEAEQPFEGGWHQALIELRESVAGGEGLRSTAEVLVPPREADFGIISDIDDTVIYSAVTNRFRMMRIVLFQDAHDRVPFPGVAAFYRALVRGPSGRGNNPIFYVSKSPWNLYDLLDVVFRKNDIPRGPLFLRDISFFSAPTASFGLEQDKLSRIRQLFSLYPSLRWVLIGDSGQKDAEIYSQIVQEHPGRVLAIYIRDVLPRRRKAVEGIAAKMREYLVPMRLEEHTTQAALHAADLRLVASDALEEIQGRRREDIQENRAQPS